RTRVRKADAEATVSAMGAEWEAQGMSDQFVTFYRDAHGLIWPTTINPRTAPRIHWGYMQAWARIKADAAGTVDDLKFAGELILLGKTMPVRSGAGAAAGGGAVAAFNAGKIAKDLLTATAHITGNGKKMLEAARLVSAMKHLSAVQKAEVILAFFQQIGFYVKLVGGAQYVDEGAHLMMYAADSPHAFRFIKATGVIEYGTYNIAARGYIWRAL
ncbi:MAG: hypothetical protein AAF570_02815, partial [Bacteroidota bacterium]